MRARNLLAVAGRLAAPLPVAMGAVLLVDFTGPPSFCRIDGAEQRGRVSVHRHHRRVARQIGLAIRNKCFCHARPSSCQIAVLLRPSRTISYRDDDARARSKEVRARSRWMALHRRSLHPTQLYRRICHFQERPSQEKEY